MKKYKSSDIIESISEKVLELDMGEPLEELFNEEFVKVSDMIDLINGGFGLNVHSFRKYLLEELLNKEFSEDVDISKLDIVINNTANTCNIKTSKILGRVLRKSAGKKGGIHIDFVEELKDVQ